MKLGTMCYVEKDNKYLMLHRTKKENDMHEGKWVGLGGKFEPHESPEECVVREVFEECGLRIQNPKLRGIITFPEDVGWEDWYVFLFTATEFTGVLKPCEEGELAWVDKGKLDELPMHKSNYHFLNWIHENEGIFSAKYIYVNGVLTAMQMTAY